MFTETCWLWIFNYNSTCVFTKYSEEFIYAWDSHRIRKSFFERKMVLKEIRQKIHLILMYEILHDFNTRYSIKVSCNEIITADEYRDKNYYTTFCFTQHACRYPITSPGIFHPSSCMVVVFHTSLEDKFKQTFPGRKSVSSLDEAAHKRSGRFVKLCEIQVYTLVQSWGTQEDEVRSARHEPVPSSWNNPINSRPAEAGRPTIHERNSSTNYKWKKQLDRL